MFYVGPSVSCEQKLW